jgi:hypothetical protein
MSYLGCGECHAGEGVPVAHERRTRGKVATDRLASLSGQHVPATGSSNTDAHFFPAVSGEEQVHRPVVDFRLSAQISVDHLSDWSRPVCTYSSYEPLYVEMSLRTLILTGKSDTFCLGLVETGIQRLDETRALARLARTVEAFKHDECTSLVNRHVALAARKRASNVIQFAGNASIASGGKFHTHFTVYLHTK